MNSDVYTTKYIKYFEGSPVPLTVNWAILGKNGWSGGAHKFCEHVTLAGVLFVLQVSKNMAGTVL